MGVGHPGTSSRTVQRPQHAHPTDDRVGWESAAARGFGNVWKGWTRGVSFRRPLASLFGSYFHFYAGPRATRWEPVPESVFRSPFRGDRGKPGSRKHRLERGERDPPLSLRITKRSHPRSAADRGSAVAADCGIAAFRAACLRDIFVLLCLLQERHGSYRIQGGTKAFVSDGEIKLRRM